MRRSGSSRTAPRAVALGAVMLAAFPAGARADDGDGIYGRFDGDLTASVEVGVSEALGDARSRGESLAVRSSLLYLSTAGPFGQYNESLGIDSQPITRSVVGGIELRPLFLGRWAKDMEHGPAHLDLWLDSISLALGIHNLWRHGRHCAPADPGAEPDCHDFGMTLSLGMELPLLPRASSPFIALRGAVRWSLEDLDTVRPAPPPMGLITLSLGYHHLFATHLVDAADTVMP